jgi:hypothetical protein
MSLFFCLDIVKPLSLRSSLLLSYLLRLNCLPLCVNMFLLFSILLFSTKKKIGGKDAEFFFRVAFQILHVFLPDILVHCALIEYAYI